MAEFNVNADALDDVIARLDGLATSELERVDRAGLVAVGRVVKPALAQMVPIARRAPGGTSLKVGELKASVRARVTKGEGDRGQASVVDFGKNNHIAHFVDAGHAVVTGGYSRINKNGSRRGPGQVVKQVPAYPFVRTLQDSNALQEEAQAAYVSAAEAEVEKVLNGK